MVQETYTHRGLIDAGYTRHVYPQYPGWVCYEPPYGKFRIAFAGNDATMNNWIENISRWKRNFPEVYAWWIDPKQKDPFHTKYGEIIIKGEDPKLVEDAVLVS